MLILIPLSLPYFITSFHHVSIGKLLGARNTHPLEIFTSVVLDTLQRFLAYVAYVALLMECFIVHPKELLVVSYNGGVADVTLCSTHSLETFWIVQLTLVDVDWS